MKKILLVVLCSLLVACGFHLRGTASLPFESLYISAPKGHPIGAEIKRAIQSGGNTLVLDKPQDAEATLKIFSVVNSKNLLSVTGGGRVREFQLHYRTTFRLTDAKGRELIPTSKIAVTRVIPFSDALVLAKQSEERVLVREMRSDSIQQIIRQLEKVQRQ
ncbi:MAG: LPS assembly lipoprotein LptE [Nitrosomonadaceae bacterium]